VNLTSTRDASKIRAFCQRLSLSYAAPDLAHPIYRRLA
jgi:hypothetical protein